ncbi:Uncharacterised protein [Serratia ficaria]|uniref:Uncharacterized protein n=1 Tax=Serratia ficaria TaxID=61651 RepID=A0A240CD35_SERFI|nr:hypothetical protein C7332_0475 [Serratia ficaria]CAI0964654.1 Uncharacterised protein [Serratia ficaria]CAI0983298.1 Uncharacterised protein [Serratia ficaria]CAI1135907.1 Uncharacterised protein [Serratia ficaria]CAI1149772.1 Uncharacterised protein [Serratia ficaria]
MDAGECGFSRLNPAKKQALNGRGGRRPGGVNALGPAQHSSSCTSYCSMIFITLGGGSWSVNR